MFIMLHRFSDGDSLVVNVLKINAIETQGTQAHAWLAMDGERGYSVKETQSEVIALIDAIIEEMRVRFIGGFTRDDLEAQRRMEREHGAP